MPEIAPRRNAGHPRIPTVDRPSPPAASPAPWRDDHLGRAVRACLSDELRSAAPSPAVRRRIARSIAAPRSPARARFGWLAWARPAETDPAPGPSRLRYVLQSGSSALMGAVLLVGALAVGNLTTAASRYPLHPRCLDYAGQGCVWDEMSAPELAIQPVRSNEAGAGLKSIGALFRVPQLRIIDREARWRRLWEGREAYNRSEWLIPPPPPTNGTVASPPVAMVLH